MIECPWWLAGTVCFCITSIAVLRFVYNVLYGIQRNLKREFNSKPFAHTPMGRCRRQIVLLVQPGPATFARFVNLADRQIKNQ